MENAIKIFENAEFGSVRTLERISKSKLKMNK